jgi:hypothetical protein
MTTALEGVRGQRHATAALYPRERPCIHCTGGWVGPRVGLDSCGKFHPPLGFDPRTVQPVTSLYTDYATRPTSASAYVVKMTKGGKVWSLICRLWLKNGQSDGLSRSAHIKAQFS